jgi:predicted RNA-binding protein YlxR (DUF448 family)
MLKKAPQRSCLSCRRVRDKAELIRIVRPPAGDLTVDPRSKLAGRGAYICPTIDCWQDVRKARRLERALGRPLPDSLDALVQAEIDRRAGNRSEEA